MIDPQPTPISELHLALMQLVHEANCWQHESSAGIPRLLDRNWVGLVSKLSAVMELPAHFTELVRRSPGLACSELCAGLFNDKTTPLHAQYLAACSRYFKDEKVRASFENGQPTTDDADKDLPTRSCA